MLSFLPKVVCHPYRESIFCDLARFELRSLFFLFVFERKHTSEGSKQSVRKSDGKATHILKVVTRSRFLPEERKEGERKNDPLVGHIPSRVTGARHSIRRPL